MSAGSLAIFNSFMARHSKSTPSHRLQKPAAPRYAHGWQKRETHS